MDWFRVMRFIAIGVAVVEGEGIKGPGYRVNIRCAVCFVEELVNLGI